MSARYTIADDVVSADVDGECVLLHLGSSTYYGLNRIGALIWTRLSSGANVDEIAASLADEYGIEVEAARVDVLALVDDLVAQGLIDIARSS